MNPNPTLRHNLVSSLRDETDWYGVDQDLVDVAKKAADMIEELAHVLNHVRTCKDTHLCPDCKKMVDHG